MTKLHTLLEVKKVKLSSKCLPWSQIIIKIRTLFPKVWTCSVLLRELKESAQVTRVPIFAKKMMSGASGWAVHRKKSLSGASGW
jgi:hypothetical protein